MTQSYRVSVVDQASTCGKSATAKHCLRAGCITRGIPFRIFFDLLKHVHQRSVRHPKRREGIIPTRISSIRKKIGKTTVVRTCVGVCVRACECAYRKDITANLRLSLLPLRILDGIKVGISHIEGVIRLRHTGAVTIIVGSATLGQLGLLQLLLASLYSMCNVNHDKASGLSQRSSSKTRPAGLQQMRAYAS